MRGKRLLFLGDSITEGTGVAQEENIYLNRLGRMAQAAGVINLGIGGTCLARNKAPQWRTGAFVVRCQTMPESAWRADVGFVFGGTNDYGIGDARFGFENSSNPFEINGALNIILHTLREMAPGMTIILVTPLRRMDDTAPNPVTGCPLETYAETILKAANRHCVPCCDLYQTVLFNPDDPADRSRYIPDGLHPNDAGHERIAKAMFRFIESL